VNVNETFCCLRLSLQSIFDNKDALSTFINVW